MGNYIVQGKIMKLDGRLSYDELVQLTKEIRPVLLGNYLKNIYHWDGLWMFKFNTFRFVYEPGICLWPGDFEPREQSIHSIGIKLRREIIDKKIISCNVNQGDRSVLIGFSNGLTLCLEFFAKGNVVLCDCEYRIIVLTRPNPFARHGDVYMHRPNHLEMDDENMVSRYRWHRNDYEIIETASPDNACFTLVEGLAQLWGKKKQTLFRSDRWSPQPMTSKKKHFSKRDNIEHQIAKLRDAMDTVQKSITEEESAPVIDYHRLTDLYQKIRPLQKKLSRAERMLHEFNPSTPATDALSSQNMIALVTDKWYHPYHWWHAPDGMLCIGGRTAEQNEKIVKSYMEDHHIYFHTEDPGSGSFIYMIHPEYVPKDYDLEYIAQGVLSLSQSWKENRCGRVYWVRGSQVSKTPPSGEYLVKGSFMIRGLRNYISVHRLQLGYVIVKENELMLGPYHFISKCKSKCLKLVPKPQTKKNSQKDLVRHLKQFLHIEKLPDGYPLFSYPCIISTNNFTEK